MNWQEIVNNSELVYASTLDDKGFRTWSLKKTTCYVSFFESYPIEDIDSMVCLILISNNGSISEEKIATILGFNVVDNFDATPKRYADKAELDIFRAIVKPVIEWGLVTRDTDIYLLTELGKRALETRIKYRFYSGEKILFENSNIKPVELKENMFFPFYSALGIFSEILNKQQTQYDEIDPAQVFDIEETDLINRHKLQSSGPYQLYESEKTSYISFDSCQVDFRLFKLKNDYYPIAFYNNQISVQATTLLYLPENIKEKDKKIEWGLYLKLIKDPDTILDFKTIIPFEDLIELDSLIKDNRLLWSDKKIFNFLAERANANQWYNISNQCPIDTIKVHIEAFSEKWDWTSLSLRIDNEFLIKTATIYPWNFEIISAKEDISIEVIKTLLLISELKDEDWDWEKLMPQLEFDFIESNIDKIDFDLSELTKSDVVDIHSLIVQYPLKRWNWSYISAEYDLSFILDNISSFSRFINLSTVLNRAFISPANVISYCNSTPFQEVLTDSKDSKLRDYSPNQAKYFWTSQLIDFLESTGYLTWESGNFVLGFECNPYIDWTFDFFKKYHYKIVTKTGFDFVSAQISDSRIVAKYSNFNWNWDTISANSSLISNSGFLLSAKDKLNFNILLANISGEVLEAIFDNANVISHLDTNQDLWSVVTEKFSIDFVRKHIDYNWDWQVLTTRFSSSIKIEGLGNPKWINKWDWKYLTQNLDLSIVSEKLDLYLDYWDWDYLSVSLDKEFILNNLPKYNSYWNWDILLKNRLDKSDLQLSKHLPAVAACISILNDELNQHLWEIITGKFDYDDLENLIDQTYYQDVFHWDYSYFYDLLDFNPRQYLKENIEFVEWKILSGSKSLNKAFRHDKSLFSYDVWLKDIIKILRNRSYHWDFKSLSRLDNINWNDSILSIESDSWDWAYLSEYSGCLKDGKEFSKRFHKFSKYIHFQVFSKRTDSHITEKLITDTIDKEWAWDLISANPSVKLTIDFIKEQKEKPWAWETLSVRLDIKLENEALIELSSQNWNWSAISNRTDITFSEEFISKLHDKPFNWYIVSQNNTFVPSKNTLSLLKDQLLDWAAISQNLNLATDILWDYRDSLDWQFVTKNKAVNLTDISLLNKYQDYLDWNFISLSEEFKPSIKYLKIFKTKLNWRIINARKDFTVSNELLEPFADVLDWSNISKSMEIQFTEELIEKYRNKWDWQLLRKNALIIEELDSSLNKYKAEFNSVDFIEHFNGKPYIYHFTHLFNAIDIIKDRKILSRHKVEGKFANAAGNIVARRETAHEFARFYFRTQTPTQFYNECLGNDSASGYFKTWQYWDGDWIECSKWKTYYPKARNLGLPKCPMPVFFKFDLKEVLIKMGHKCYYSTGNMQTNWARVEKVSENPNEINTTYLYSTVSDYENYKQYSQQEFLIYEEFDFSELNSFEIICFDNEQVRLLKQLIGENNPICNKITTDRYETYHRGNRKLCIETNDDVVSIYSEYKDSAYFSVTYKENRKINILGGNILKEETGRVIAYPNIKFSKSDKDIEVKFYDESNREWLIYKS